MIYLSVIEDRGTCDQCNRRRPRVLTTYANCTPGMGANGTPILGICTKCSNPTATQWMEFIVRRARRFIRRMGV